jgi:hypothetical protein
LHAAGIFAFFSAPDDQRGNRTQESMMPTRKAEATWDGGLRGGKGSFKGESGAVGGQYNFGSRFE